MAFTNDEFGFENAAGKLVVTDPPIIVERDEETGPDASHEVSLTGSPVVVIYNRTQEESFLRLHLRLLTAAQKVTLKAIMRSKTTTAVKIAAGTSTTITCMFGARSEQDIQPWNNHHAETQTDGSAVDPLLTQYWAELFLLRMG